jgi:hypothetical protein
MLRLHRGLGLATLLDILLTIWWWRVVGAVAETVAVLAVRAGCLL